MLINKARIPPHPDGYINLYSYGFPETCAGTARLSALFKICLVFGAQKYSRHNMRLPVLENRSDVRTLIYCQLTKPQKERKYSEWRRYGNSNNLKTLRRQISFTGETHAQLDTSNHNLVSTLMKRAACKRLFLIPECAVCKTPRVVPHRNTRCKSCSTLLRAGGTCIFYRRRPQDSSQHQPH